MRSAQLQWSVSLMPLLTFPDDEARSYVGWTIAIINGLSEEQRKEFFVAQRIPLLPSATDVSSSMDIDSTSDRPSFSAHEILWVGNCVWDSFSARILTRTIPD